MKFLLSLWTSRLSRCSSREDSHNTLKNAFVRLPNKERLIGISIGGMLVPARQEKRVPVDFARKVMLVVNIC